MVEYESIVYDLSPFEIGWINNIIVDSDADEGVQIKVSFDAGKSYQTTSTMNEKTTINKPSTGIKVKITLNNPGAQSIYRVKTTGFFQNYSVGTEIVFIKRSSEEQFATKLGGNGRYQIYLPRGVYDVYVKNDIGKLDQIMFDFNPETTFDIPTHRLDKENTIEQFMRDVDWVKYCIFDTFDDKDKMKNGSAYIDIDGDLCNFETNTKCRYWAIGFD